MSHGHRFGLNSGHTWLQRLFLHVLQGMIHPLPQIADSLQVSFLRQMFLVSTTRNEGLSFTAFRWISLLTVEGSTPSFLAMSGMLAESRNFSSMNILSPWDRCPLSFLGMLLTPFPARKAEVIICHWSRNYVTVFRYTK